MTQYSTSGIRSVGSVVLALLFALALLVSPLQSIVYAQDAPSNGVFLPILIGGGGTAEATSLSIAATGALVNETNAGTTPFTFVVTRSGRISGATTVDYTVSGRGAAPATADDFAGGVMPSGQLSFAPGESSKTLNISVQGDSTMEEDEGFSVTLANASGGAQIASERAVGLIRNDDGTPAIDLSLAASDANKTEGDGVTFFTFTVTRSGGTSGATLVDYSVSGSGAAASADDFGGGVLPSGQLSFAPGESSKILTISVQGDTNEEPDESFVVTLANASDGAQITSGSATGTILNDDKTLSAELSLSASDADKMENSSDSGAFNFTVTRNGNASVATTVDYGVSGSGASPADGADFAGGVLPNGQLAFAPGETSKTLAVNVQSDGIVEPDEDFLVTLANASDGAQIIASSAIGAIRNDDVTELAQLRWAVM